MAIPLSSPSTEEPSKETPSPLLFLIFIEPLLRWLHHDQQGYYYGCLTPQQNAQHHASSNAYADDLSIHTNTIEHLKIQASKVTAFCQWGGLKVNHNKCAVTGATYARWTQHTGHIYPTIDLDLQNSLTDQVKIQDKPIPYIHPGADYEYLGFKST